MLFFEHKHLYRRIKGEVPDERYTTPIGKARIHQEGDDVTRHHVGRDGLHRRRGGEEVDASVEIIDLRTIVPWDKRGGARLGAQDVEGARAPRGHPHRRLRRRDRRDDRRGGVRGPRRAGAAPRRARHARPVLARAREGVHPAGRRRRPRVEGVDRATDGHAPPQSTSSCRRWASPSPRGRSRNGRRRSATRSRPTRRCSRSRPTRSTRRCRRRRPASSSRSSSRRARRSRSARCSRGSAARRARRACRRSRLAPTPRARARSRLPSAARRARQRLLPLRSPPRRGRARRERQGVRLAGRRPDRGRARHRPGAGAGHRHRRARHEEGHPGVHRAGRAGTPRSRRLRRRAAARDAAPPPAVHRPRRRLRPRAAGARRAAGRESEPRAGDGETLEPMTAMRRGIAEHMRRSLDTSAHVTSRDRGRHDEGRRRSARS